MSGQPSMTAEADAFVLSGERVNVKWLVTRMPCYWACSMSVDERPVSYTSLSARPDKHDPLLRKIERNYFHEC